jgi:hypothetical protein
MTNTLQFKLLTDDESYFLGALLLRWMPAKDTVERKGVLISILKMLSYNMPAAKDLDVPKFKDERTFKLSTMIKGASSSFNNLLKSFKKFAQSGKGSVASLIWPREFRPIQQPLLSLTLPTEEKYRRDRRWITPRVRDFSCSTREFGLSDGGQGINVTSSDLKSFYNLSVEAQKRVHVAQEPSRVHCSFLSFSCCTGVCSALCSRSR